MDTAINPDKKDLRNFAFIIGGMMAVFFGLLLPWIWDWSYPLWPWIVTAIATMWGLVHPFSLKPLYWAWMKLALMLGWVNTRIILSVVFYLLILPFGMVMRIFGKDPMHRKFSDKIATYRVESNQPNVDHLDRPF